MMASSRSNGIVIGVVADLDDTDGLRRVRVQFPHLRNALSDWARVVTPMAGNGRGFFWRPEKGDEVLVLFEHGDPSRPYIIGGVWSIAQKHPDDDGNQPDNNWRFIRSRSGHLIKLDDTAGKERIEIVDKDGSRQIVIDCSAAKIQIICDDGDIEVKAASGTVSVEGMTVKVKASESLSLEADGEVTIKGATVNIN